MKLKNIALAFVLGCSVLLFTYCTKDYFNGDKINKAIENTQWSPEFAIPLVYASYSIGDLIKQASGENGEIIQVDNNNLVTLIYSGELISLSAEDAFSIPNQSFDESFQSGQFVPSLPANDSITFPVSSSDETFSVGAGNQVDSIRLKSGTLNLTLNSDFKHHLKIVLTIPSAKKDGIEFSTVLNANYSGSTPVTASTTVNLSDYTFDLTKNGTTFNNLEVEFEATIYGTGNEVLPTDEISLSGSINNLGFSAIFGYLDISGISTQADSIPITVFNAAQGFGTFSLVNPSVKFVLENSIGIPLQASFDELKGVNTNSGTVYDLSTNPDIPSPLPIPTPDFSQVGEVVVDSFTLSNQGIVDLLNDQPRLLIYSINAGTDGSANQESFILDTSRFTVNTEVTMPLYGTADIFTLQDTIPISLSGDSSSSSSETNVEIVRLTMKTIIENEYPVDTKIQIYTLNGLGIITDSILPANTIIPSAVVNATNGVVTTPGFLDLEIEFDENRVANINDMENIIIRASATTYNGGNTNVKIYDFYTLDVKMGVKTKITSNLTMEN